MKTIDLSGLDEEQTEAVLVGPEPLIVAAGAGSGKTRMITHRVAHLAATNQIDPGRTVLTTFTKSAAIELQERINALGCEQVQATTLHSWMFQVINTHRAIENQPALAVIDEFKRKQWIRNLLAPRSKDFPEALGRKTDLSVALGEISGWKAQLIGPNDHRVTRLLTGSDPDRAAAAAVYPLYEARLLPRNNIDFDGMLVEAHRILSTDPTALARVQANAQAVFSDESQDTNHVQWELLELLCPPADRPCLTLVGDPRQAIYQWRHALPDRFTAATERWNAKSITLVRNYRSAQHVVDAANKVIANVGLPDMTPTRPEPGTIVAYETSGAVTEAIHVAQWARAHLDSGVAGSALAVLARTNAQSVPVERALFAAGIPYWCASGGFFSRFEIKALLGYLRLAVDPTDEDALHAIINKPTRYLGREFVNQVIKEAGRTKNLLRALPRTDRYGSRSLSLTQRDSALALADLIATIGSTDPAHALETVILDTGFEAWLKHSEGSVSEEDTRTDNISTLLELAAEFRTTRAFLTHVDQVEAAMQHSPDAVRISTVHRAKGQEWPHVTIIGAGDQTLPHHLAVASGMSDEERRLMYVAATRARDSLTILYPQVFGQPPRDQGPSPFITDMGLEVQTPPEVDEAALFVNRPGCWLTEGLEPDDKQPGQVSLFASGATPPRAESTAPILTEPA